MDSWIDSARSVLESLPGWAVASLGVMAIGIVALAADVVAKRQLVRAAHRVSRRSERTWDDALAEHGVFRRVAQIIPAFILFFSIPLIPGLGPDLVTLGRNVALAYAILILSLALSALLSAANAVYEQYPVANERPIKGYLQVVKIVVFVVAAVLILATLMERSPVLLLSGLGAMTAVLLLIFRDTILSLVASVQLSGQDMVRVGDWVEMPQCNADGDVIDIALHTVKVQNWDKTITTIPTHRLISESFKNWRGMSDSGGRRIKRSLVIDVNSIRFLSVEEVDELRRFKLLTDYIAAKERELDEYNASLGADSPEFNQRRLTNVGTFRAYVFNYLKHHPKIHRDMTLLVRQLSIGAQGLPLEIYAFTNTTEWSAYEDIQADIFDHLLAIAGEFGLSVYQEPSGGDFRVAIRPSAS